MCIPHTDISVSNYVCDLFEQPRLMQMQHQFTCSYIPQSHRHNISMIVEFVCLSYFAWKAWKVLHVLDHFSAAEL